MTTRSSRSCSAPPAVRRAALSLAELSPLDVRALVSDPLDARNCRALLRAFTPQSCVRARRGQLVSAGVLVDVREDRPGHSPQELLGLLCVLPERHITPQTQEVQAHLSALRAEGALLSGHEGRSGRWLSGLFHLSAQAISLDRLRSALEGTLPDGALTAQLAALRCRERLARPDVFAQGLASVRLQAHQVPVLSVPYTKVERIALALRAHFAARDVA